MKNTTKLFSGLFAIAIVVTTLATTTSAFAYQGDPSVQGPDYSPERHEAMQDAFNTNNYGAWEELMVDKGRVTQNINADNFAKFTEANKLAQSGDLEGAKEIRAELGLGLKDGSGQGNGQGLKDGNGQGKRSGGGQGMKDGSGSRANRA